jgi:hypothetical protein
VRIHALAVAATLVAGLVSADGTSQPRAAALDESVRLKVGEAARIEAEDLHLGFERVKGDSRCPKGVQCIWEGDATVVVWIQKGSEAKEMLELHTSSKGPAAASFRDYVVRLARLEPEPVSGRDVDPAAYVATLSVSRGSADERRQ